MKKIKMLFRLMFAKNAILITSKDMTTDTFEVDYQINTDSNNLDQHQRMLKGVIEHMPKHFEKFN